MPASMAMCALTASRVVMPAKARGASIRMCSVTRVPAAIGANATVVCSRTRGN